MIKIEKHYFKKKSVDDALCLQNAPFQRFFGTWVHSQSRGEQTPRIVSCLFLTTAFFFITVDLLKQ